MISIFSIVKLIELFIRPGMLLVELALLGLLFLASRRMRVLAFLLLTLGFGGLVTFAVTPAGVWMLRPLEDRFPRPDPMPTKVTGIILLGGAIDLPVSLGRHVTALNIRGDRLLAFLQLARRYPDARLIFTGGNASPFGGKGSEAQVARRLFLSLGISPRRLEFESRSRNTRENALFTYRLVNPKPGQVWLLVTSAADMPRAVGCFRAIGWPAVVPYPVDYHTRPQGAAWLPGLSQGLTLADWAAHEWLGLVYYRLRGWTPSWFPAPVNGRTIAKISSTRAPDGHTH